MKNRTLGFIFWAAILVGRAYEKLYAGFYFFWWLSYWAATLVGRVTKNRMLDFIFWGGHPSR